MSVAMKNEIVSAVKGGMSVADASKKWKRSKAMVYQYLKGAPKAAMTTRRRRKPAAIMTTIAKPTLQQVENAITTLRGAGLI